MNSDEKNKKEATDQDEKKVDLPSSENQNAKEKTDQENKSTSEQSPDDATTEGIP